MLFNALSFYCPQPESCLSIAGTQDTKHRIYWVQSA